MKGGHMHKRLCVIGLAALLFIGFTGCGEQLDTDEQREADNLLNGLGLMSMMTNVDAYSGYSTSPGLTAPPFGWSGPNSFDLPEGSDTLFYQWQWKVPLDSMGVFLDSLIWLCMPIPNVWGADSDSLWTGINTWIIGESRNMIYFHTEFSVEDTSRVMGLFKWNWEDTYYEYDYMVSILDLNESAEIDITTSANIGLSAQFRFLEDGSGSTEDNFAAWNDQQFVRYEFFADPDEQGYDGYYELLSEGWKVRHYFRLIDQGTF
jgi:hypothetical protein